MFMMDDPNITIEEYIKLQAEKSQRRGQMFNWETATYGKIYCDNLHFFTDFEVDFPAIVYNDALASNENVSSEPTVNMALPPRDQRHPFLRFEGLEYTDANIADFEERLGKIYGRGVHRVHVFDFGGSTAKMVEGLSVRMLMEHRDAQGQSVFTSCGWRRLFEIRGLLVHELILEFFSTFRLGEAVLGFDMVRALQFQLGGAKRRMSWREFTLAMGLHTAKEMESVGFDTYKADSARQIPDKGDLNLSVIDLAELVQLKIYDELDDTSAWVAPRPKRQPDVATKAPKDVEGAHAEDEGVYAKDEGAQAVPAPV
ncbi:hypothetical protein Tco_0127399 [Tanacetum coccineum]